MDVLLKHGADINATKSIKSGPQTAITMARYAKFCFLLVNNPAVTNIRYCSAGRIILTFSVSDTADIPVLWNSSNSEEQEIFSKPKPSPWDLHTVYSYAPSKTKSLLNSKSVIFLLITHILRSMKPLLEFLRETSNYTNRLKFLCNLQQSLWAEKWRHGKLCGYSCLPPSMICMQSVIIW